MQVEYHRLHAFTTTRFHTGNPAAVFLLSSSPSSLSAESRQNLATEANLPNSVFLNPATTTSEGDEIPTYAADFYSRRAQIPLCGHATLCAASHLFSTTETGSDVIRFETVLSGTVYARREEGGRVAIDFPANHDGLVELDEGDDRSKKAVQGVLEAVEGLREEDVLAVAWVPLGPIVELATEVDLGGLKVDVEGFVSPRITMRRQRI